MKFLHTFFSEETIQKLTQENIARTRVLQYLQITTVNKWLGGQKTAGLAFLTGRSALSFSGL
jgi:hypothetical protein